MSPKYRGICLQRYYQYSNHSKVCNPGFKFELDSPVLGRVSLLAQALTYFCKYVNKIIPHSSSRSSCHIISYW